MQPNIWTQWCRKFCLVLSFPALLISLTTALKALLASFLNSTRIRSLLTITFKTAQSQCSCWCCDTAYQHSWRPLVQSNDLAEANFCQTLNVLSLFLSCLSLRRCPLRDEETSYFMNISQMCPNFFLIWVLHCNSEFKHTQRFIPKTAKGRKGEQAWTEVAFFIPTSTWSLRCNLFSPL